MLYKWHVQPLFFGLNKISIQYHTITIYTTRFIWIQNWPPRLSYVLERKQLFKPMRNIMKASLSGSLWIFHGIASELPLTTSTEVEHEAGPATTRLCHVTIHTGTALRFMLPRHLYSSYAKTHRERERERERESERERGTERERGERC